MSKKIHPIISKFFFIHNTRAYFLNEIPSLNDDILEECSAKDLSNRKSNWRKVYTYTEIGKKDRANSLGSHFKDPIYFKFIGWNIFLAFKIESEYDNKNHRIKEGIIEPRYYDYDKEKENLSRFIKQQAF